MPVSNGSGCYSCPVFQSGCDAQYRGSRCAEMRAKAGVDFDPKTNADRIREMDDKHLGEFLAAWAASGCIWRRDPGEILGWLRDACLKE